MIVDNLANAVNHFSLHPRFEKAFEYIRELEMEKEGAGIVFFSPVGGHAPLFCENSAKKMNSKVAVI